MKQELELKLQAWVDGELNEGEARRIAQVVSEDPVARGLVAELRAVKKAMNGAEMTRAVPDGHEFYWSKIQRQIAAEERHAAPTRAPWLRLWQRIALPLAGVAAAACVVLVTVKQVAPPAASPCDEVTATSDAMDTMTYHDQSTGLTVVWLQDKTSAQPATATVVEDDNSVDTD